MFKKTSAVVESKEIKAAKYDALDIDEHNRKFERGLAIVRMIYIVPMWIVGFLAFLLFLKVFFGVCFSFFC